MASTSPLVVENVRKQFRQGDRAVAALDGVSLEVPQGQFLAIMGASGSGKSTLLHLMAGLAMPDEGRVVIDGTELKGMSDRNLTLFRRPQQDNRDGHTRADRRRLRAGSRRAEGRQADQPLRHRGRRRRGGAGPPVPGESPLTTAFPCPTPFSSSHWWRSLWPSPFVDR